ncbi:ATPase, T2SS/T4P/T4SS family [Candidatus Terasakiella magnetica]|nr:ATPase, T2SS/T4P/T4SS family [Candidatus Terasakiella magnetica]
MLDSNSNFCNLRDNELKPLHPYLYCNEGDKFWEISEININEFGEVWVDRWGQQYQERVVDNNLSQMKIHDMMAGIATFNDLPFDTLNNQVVATQIPGGHRFQGTFGGSVINKVAISIRIKRPFVATFEDFGVTPEQIRIIMDVLARGGNIYVVGGTSTGKTTFLKILLHLLDPRLRLILIEDTAELEAPHLNQVRHIAKRFDTGTGLGYDRKMDTVIRENPDALGVGELSIFNAFPSFNIMNLGNESFYSTAHANNPLEFLDGFRTRVMLDGHNASGVVEGLVRRLDLIIQLGRDGEKRVIKDLVDPEDLPWRSLVGGEDIDNANDNRLERIHNPFVKRNLKGLYKKPNYQSQFGDGGLMEDEKLFLASQTG